MIDNSLPEDKSSQFRPPLEGNRANRPVARDAIALQHASHRPKIVNPVRVACRRIPIHSKGVNAMALKQPKLRHPPS
jgi:hypothetical protein